MIALGDARKPRYYEKVVHPFYRKASPTKSVHLYLPSLEVWSAPDSRYHVKRRPNTLSMEDNPFKKGVMEGVVAVNPDIFSKAEKVFVEITARYIYNKSVIDRYNFNINRIAFRAYRVMYPPRSTLDSYKTYEELDSYWKPVQEFIRKQKTNHFPFYFDLNDGPDSLWMFDFYNPETPKRHNGVIWECYAYVGLLPTPTPNPTDTALLGFRKLTFIPEEYRPKLPIPMNFQDRQFSTCTCKTDNGVITLCARLDKFTYCHNEPIKVYVKVHNSSERVIQRVIISVQQITEYETYENNDILTQVDSCLLNDEVKELPILPWKEDWKVKIELRPSVRRSEKKEMSIEPPERNASQDPLDCFLSSTSFPFEEMEKLLTSENAIKLVTITRSVDSNEDRTSFIAPHKYRRQSDVPKNPIEGLINPIKVRYRVNVKTECPIPFTACIKYEAPELNLDFYLVHCEPTVANYIPVECKKMENPECIY